MHAQFETIHPYPYPYPYPYPDGNGNGRVGRALVHAVLTRRGLTSAAVLPVSLVLLTRSDEYLAGLTAYRYVRPGDSSAAQVGISHWIATFLDAAELAADQVTRFARELDELRNEWATRLSGHRARLGIRAAPRADSATARLMEVLPEAPLVTTTTVQRMLGVSGPAAYKATEELAEAGIVTRRRLGAERPATSRATCSSC